MATPPTDLDLHELVTDVAGFGVAAAVVVSGYRRLRRWLQRPSAPPDPSAGAAPSDSELEPDGDQYHDALDNPTSDAGPSPSPPPKRARPSPEPALPEQHDARLRHLMGQLASMEVLARDLGLQMELGGLPRVGSQARQLAAHVAEFCQRLRAAAAAMEGMPDDRAMAGLAALVEQSPFALDGLEKWLQHSEADGRRLLELAETHTLTLVDSGRLRGLAHRPDTPHLLVLAADMGGSSRAEELLVQMAEVLGREGALVCVGADHRPVAVRRPEWEPSQMDLQAELDLLHGFGGEGVVSCFLDVTAEAAESLRLHFRVPEAVLAAGPAVLWLERGHFIGTLADAMDMIFCDAALFGQLQFTAPKARLCPFCLRSQPRALVKVEMSPGGPQLQRHIPCRECHQAWCYNCLQAAGTCRGQRCQYPTAPRQNILQLLQAAGGAGGR